MLWKSPLRTTHADIKQISGKEERRKPLKTSGNSLVFRRTGPSRSDSGLHGVRHMPRQSRISFRINLAWKYGFFTEKMFCQVMETLNESPV